MSQLSKIVENAVNQFVKTFFRVLAFFSAIFFILVVVALVSKVDKPQYRQSQYEYTLLANHKGLLLAKQQKLPFVLVVDIQGVIGDQHLNKDTVFNQLQYVYENFKGKEKPRALLLRLNSPGGVALDGHSIYRDIVDFKKKMNIPCYAFVDGLCASASFYVTSACDKVYASNLSLIGNIGAKMEFYNAYEGIHQLGISYRPIEAGGNKNAMHPLLPINDKDKVPFQKLVDEAYNHLVTSVVTSRPHLSKEVIMRDWGADVFSALEAEKLGLVDHSDSNYFHVLENLVDQAGILGDYHVIRLENRSWDVSGLLQPVSTHFSKAIDSFGGVSFKKEILKNLESESLQLR